MTYGHWHALGSNSAHKTISVVTNKFIASAMPFEQAQKKLSLFLMSFSFLLHRTTTLNWMFLLIFVTFFHCYHNQSHRSPQDDNTAHFFYPCVETISAFQYIYTQHIYFILGESIIQHFSPTCMSQNVQQGALTREK